MRRLYRLRIEKAPAEAERRDLLEIILAAASLDLDIELLLMPGALQLLWPKPDPGWQQLLDHKLAHVIQVCPPTFAGTLSRGVLAVQSGSLPRLPANGVELTL